VCEFYDVNCGSVLLLSRLEYDCGEIMHV